MTTQDTFTLVLNTEQLNTIIAGLNELPAKFANPVIKVISDQLTAATTKAE